MRDLLDRYINPLKRRVLMMLARATISAIKDGGDLQTLQLDILSDETQDDVARVQEYGFTSNPLPGAEAVVAFLGGSRDHGVVIAVDDRRYRLKSLAPGEVAIYTDEGDKIHLKRNRTIEVLTQTLKITASVKVEITTPELLVTGDISSGGTITAADDVLAGANVVAAANVSDSHGSMAADRTVYNGHTHLENNAPGSHTDAPDQPM